MFILFLFYLSFSIPLHAQQTRRRVSLPEILKFPRERERHGRETRFDTAFLSSRATNGFFDKLQREDLFATRNKITHSFSLLFKKSL